MAEFVDDESDHDDDGTCQHCGGEGGFHDCGEDTCCCDGAIIGGPEDHDWWACAYCGATGYER